MRCVAFAENAAIAVKSARNRCVMRCVAVRQGCQDRQHGQDGQRGIVGILGHIECDHLCSYALICAHMRLYALICAASGGGLLGGLLGVLLGRILPKP